MQVSDDVVIIYSFWHAQPLTWDKLGRYLLSPTLNLKLLGRDLCHQHMAYLTMTIVKRPDPKHDIDTIERFWPFNPASDNIQEPKMAILFSQYPIEPSLVGCGLPLDI
jgi:hypothetical protein